MPKQKNKQSSSNNFYIMEYLAMVGIVISVVFLEGLIERDLNIFKFVKIILFFATLTIITAILTWIKKSISRYFRNE